jgi:Protein of unknown function (DUF5818)
MKKLSLWSLFLAITLAASVLQSGSVLRAQDQSQNPPASGVQQPQRSAHTFTGTIAKTGHTFVLKDEASGASYRLDDQDKAKSFQGKSVKVTGTLDAQSNTIHVQEIEPAG